MTHLSSNQPPKWKQIIDQSDWNDSIANTKKESNENFNNTSVFRQKSSWSCTEKRNAKKSTDDEIAARIRKTQM